MSEQESRRQIILQLVIAQVVHSGIGDEWADDEILQKAERLADKMLEEI